jgi:hypothetical protein
MTVYSDAEAKQKLDALLEQACAQGEVRIKRQDGQEFVVRPASGGRSPLDVGSVPVNLSAEEIVDAVKESRRR